MEYNITTIIQAVFALIAAVITVIVIPYIKKARPQPSSRRNQRMGEDCRICRRADLQRLRSRS